MFTVQRNVKAFSQLFVKHFLNTLNFSSIKNAELLKMGLKACNFVKKRLQHRCFPVKFSKFLRTPILKNICEQLLLGLLIQIKKVTFNTFDDFYTFYDFFLKKKKKRKEKIPPRSSPKKRVIWKVWQISKKVLCKVHD